MPDDALLWNAPPRKPQPAESIWSMQKPNGNTMDAFLRGQGEFGSACQFFVVNGEFLQSRLWTTRAQTLAQAEEEREELEGRGYRTAALKEDPRSESRL
jgi:hypothetical protein